MLVIVVDEVEDGNAADEVKADDVVDNWLVANIGAAFKYTRLKVWGAKIIEGDETDDEVDCLTKVTKAPDGGASVIVFVVTGVGHIFARDVTPPGLTSVTMFIGVDGFCKSAILNFRLEQLSYDCSKTNTMKSLKINQKKLKA